jgi:alcohol dehydrogenase class IV
MAYVSQSVPEILFGAGALDRIGAQAAARAGASAALLIADPRLVATGVAGRAADSLAAAGLAPAVFSAFSGEPKAADAAAAAEAARSAGAGVVIGLGGGSALDIAKLAAFCAVSGADPEQYAEARSPLPKPLPKILVPTTAGAGSETTSTAVFARADGRKTWAWGPAAKPELVVLDPALTVTLPPHLTAWTGMDAFVHAFEASTNRNASPASKRHGHAALRLIAKALPRAVALPDDLAARGDMLWGAALAGSAIDNAGTAIAHTLSHALASLAPVHHGLATALAFEVTLPWLAAAETDDLAEAAAALGLRAVHDLPAFVSGLMDRAGLVRALPEAFAAVTPAALAAEARDPANAPMRRSTVRPVDDAALDGFCARLLALAPGTDARAA